MSDSNESNPYYDPNSPPSCQYWGYECENLSFWKNPVDKAAACSMVAFTCSDSQSAYGLPAGGRPPSMTTPGQTTTPATQKPPSSDGTTTTVAPATATPATPVPAGMSSTAKAVAAVAIAGGLYLAYRTWK